MPEVRLNPGKWQRNSSQAADDYAQGAASPRRSWSQAAAAAEDTYVQSVTEAASAGRYGKGVQEAGDGKWQSGIREKGRSRYSQGVQTAADEYRAGFAPYADVIRGVTLPPRGVKGQNYERVRLIGEALRAAKEGR